MAVQHILRNILEESSANTRAERALVLFEERGHLIRSVTSDTFEVPSQRMQGKRYRVHYGTADLEACECPDHTYRGAACVHILAVGIMHASRRSGVKARTIPGAYGLGDPFAHAGRRRECSACFAGYVSITVEEDGAERLEPMACRRCGGTGRRP